MPPGEDRFEEETLAPVRFVPLIGKEGWDVTPPSDVDEAGVPEIDASGV